MPELDLTSVEAVIDASFAFKRNAFRPSNFFGNCFAMDDCIALSVLANAAPLMVFEIKRLRAEQSRLQQVLEEVLDACHVGTTDDGYPEIVIHHEPYLKGRDALSPKKVMSTSTVL